MTEPKKHEWCEYHERAVANKAPFAEGDKMLCFCCTCKPDDDCIVDIPCPHSFTPCEWENGFRGKTGELLWARDVSVPRNGIFQITPIAKRVTKVFCSLCLETKELE